MFSTSTQRKFWTFSGETELNRLRTEANQKFVTKHGMHMTDEERHNFFLTASEEKYLCRYYEYAIKEFCSRFQPPMPKYVVGTSITFFKRFYLHHSVMDYHPRDIMLTSVYLACKVEEFNVTIIQFVSNLKGDREKYADMILGYELLLMEFLHYHLTVHNPYRPLEGLFIDLKTRCPELESPESLRSGADQFIDKSCNTDNCLIFSPSQISLAALLSSASKQGINLDSYVANTLLSGGKENLTKTVEQIKRIKYKVRNIEPCNNKEQIREIEMKLSKCRNPENNPDSEVYKRKMESKFDEEEERKSHKRMKQAEEQKKQEQELLGL